MYSETRRRDLSDEGDKATELRERKERDTLFNPLQGRHILVLDAYWYVFCCCSNDVMTVWQKMLMRGPQKIVDSLWAMIL